MTAETLADSRETTAEVVVDMAKVDMMPTIEGDVVEWGRCCFNIKQNLPIS